MNLKLFKDFKNTRIPILRLQDIKTNTHIQRRALSHLQCGDSIHPNELLNARAASKHLPKAGHLVRKKKAKGTVKTDE